MNLQNKTILIVDDTEFHRILLADLLEEIGITNILMAENGLQAVRMARYYKPDLVLLDLIMPNIDGYETCEKIRLFANKVTMPVIVITGLEKETSLERVFKLGANDYFEKPFNRLEVANRILFYLEYFDILKKFNIIEDYIQGDMEIAKSVQHNILPNPEQEQESLKENGLDFYTYYRPFDGIGGDSWSVHRLISNDPVMLICDISGHGINAAINNSFAMSAIASVFELHAFLPADQFSPASFLDNLNFIFSAHMQTGTFGAAGCLLYNKAGHKILYAGCALPDIWVVNLESGQIQRKPCNGFPIGIMPDELEPVSGEIGLGVHDLVLLMSDGIIESSQPDADKKNTWNDTELPGEKMMYDALTNLAQMHQNNTEKMPAKECVANIIDSFEGRGFDLTSDDMTLLALQRL
jgi:sigma-B regulation protein RsbU (phosphoserine phosphatase)